MANLLDLKDFWRKIRELYTTVVGSMRYVFGSVIMIGVAPEYLAIWLVWRGASLVFPSWIYQWGDDKLYSLYQRLVLFFFETCTNLEVVLYGDAVDALKKRESVLYLANHQSTVDWLVADMISVRGGSLGHLRYVMKDTLQLMPLYGHYFYAHGCIYVKRGKFSQNKMIEALDYLRHPKIPTWLVIFPEGTRYYPGNPDVIQKAEQYAKDNNLPVLKHHLVPKTRGMWLVSRQLHDKIDAIYDVSVFYDGTVNKQGIRGNAPQLIDFLMGKCKKVHVHIRRIPMSEVPMEEEKVGKWLHQLYREKDELAENFFTPDSEKRNNVEKLLNGHKSSLNLWSTLSSFLFFSVLSVPFLCTKVGRQMYVNLLLYGSLGSYGWLVIRNVC
ncbi:1-acyl-sn-glycerol-3-phosphate acyltransferase epsilon-like isoform X3 [Penaeus monodon]|uniref:1-acyl-sn-glycerol-3-phosphate acyltransferase epsilon-like isoform X3 n=1 Tax=Penaeus monodon TaxID=6687 RepID=UPI0018A78CE7|nr:1-acyl-sn-glycerol-3-phosphate acyltransferase epsilon-like isoform X3 [Penaeus monodon]